MMPRPAPPSLSLFLALVPFLAFGQTIDPAVEYPACMAQARAEPEAGFERATTWEGLGGGEPARHCAAVALMGMGEWAEAGDRLERLAQASRRPSETRAEMLAQAAQAWARAGAAKRAVGLLDLALGLDPRNLAARIDRGVIRAGLGDRSGARDDADAVLREAPRDVDALVLRAALRRADGDLRDAERDLAVALRADREHVLAWLEWGEVLMALKRRDDARRAWATVLRLAPGGPEGAVARTRLEELEAGTRAPSGSRRR